MTVTAWEYAARMFETHKRPWATPGAMAADLRLPLAAGSSPALDRIDQELVQLVDDRDTPDRLMIFMPPQEGKSQKVSRTFPLWLLADDPTLRIAIVSFEAGKAERWGKACRRDIATNPRLNIRLHADSRAAGRWETIQGGGLICVGLQGGITGEPVDVLIIDDPVKGRAEAESATYREAAWDWWESNGSTRLSERGIVILMNTRWHEDDLAGRILANEGHEWSVLSIPAIAEANDPIGRAPGEELTSVRGRKPGFFTRLREIRSSYAFRSIYQQAPVAAEGNLFKRGDYRYWQPQGPDLLRLDDRTWQVAECFRFVTIDLATSTRTSADYTVAAAWAITAFGDLILLDRVRKRVEQAGHFDLVTPLRTRWLQPTDTVFVESRMFGTTFVYAAGRSGIPIQELEADADKLTRALPAAGLVQQHKVWFPAGVDWLDVWCDELAAFPTGTHDDQVDVFAYAARVAAAHWVPQEAAYLTDRRRAAQRASSGELDLMTAPY